MYFFVVILFFLSGHLFIQVMRQVSRVRSGSLIVFTSHLIFLTTFTKERIVFRGV